MVKCGVNPSLYTEYKFGDHIWNTPKFYDADKLELAQRCVNVKGEYWLKLPNTNIWEAFNTIVNARKQAINTWSDTTLTSGTIITAELIDEFFEGFRWVVQGKKMVKENGLGSVPNLSGRMVIPYGPKMVTYKNRPYLNTSGIEIIAGRVEDREYAKLLLPTLYRALCGGKPLDGASNRAAESEGLLTQVLKNDWSELGLEFRFLMNWLAAIVQEPGINLQTNVWILGQLQGIGKGTLLTIMKKIFGNEGVATLQQAEIEAGWTDHLLGAVLVEVNEFDVGNSNKSGKWWNKWIKAHTCDVELPIRERNVGAWPALNIGNYIFTSNDESPVYMDKSDRRSFVIKATDDIYWKEYASLLQSRYINNGKLDNLASGLAWLLLQVKVDKDLIKSAPLNEIKAEIQTASMDTVEEWIRSDVLIKRDEWTQSALLWERFKAWYESQSLRGGNKSSDDVSTQNKWARKMSGLCKRKIIEKDIRRDAAYYKIPMSIEDITLVGDRKGAEADVFSIVAGDGKSENYDEVLAVKQTVDLGNAPRLTILRAALREQMGQEERFERDLSDDAGD